MDNPDLGAFARYVPGFEFLQNLARQTGSMGSSSAMPSLGHWVAPTFDVQELDRRIQELKTVHFWLEQNAKALAATVQALEVQKMTLATLQGMNVSLNEVAEAMKMPILNPLGAAPEAANPPDPAPSVGSARGRASAAADDPAPADAAATGKTGEEGEASASGNGPGIDPMQWWGSLTQQFQAIAAGALRDMAEQTRQAGEAFTAAAEPAASASPEGTKPRAATRQASAGASRRAPEASTGGTRAKPASRSGTTRRA